MAAAIMIMQGRAEMIPHDNDANQPHADMTSEVCGIRRGQRAAMRAMPFCTEKAMAGSTNKGAGELTGLQWRQLTLPVKGGPL